MSEWNPHAAARNEAKGKTNSRVLTIWALAALTVLAAAACLNLVKQDASAKELSELKYRVQAIERRPARLSESDRAAIVSETQAQVDRALLSRR